MAVERSDLKNRTIPEMRFCSPGSPAPQSRDFKTDQSTEPALERFRVKGNAIVTGGGGDLGSTAARALLQHGLKGLIVFDLDLVEAGKRIEKLKAEFPAAAIDFRKVNITDADMVRQAVDEVVELLGSVDILLNFAGVVSVAHSVDEDPNNFRRTMEINSTGAFLISQAVGRKMISAKTGGSIILIASISGHQVNFPQPQVAYNTSKAAVMMIKNSLAAEWAVHGIRVNSISPGYMDTILNEGDGLEDAKKQWYSRNPMGRMGNREELTGAVVLLASRAGSYINGADILVDGGQTLTC
ncbi:NAD(P)-binding protein [Thozetella sp. PMI_491]|nr:NAD(P)-binding protein [Thozetella sp. PMI_491]